MLLVLMVSIISFIRKLRAFLRMIRFFFDKNGLIQAFNSTLMALVPKGKNVNSMVD